MEFIEIRDKYFSVYSTRFSGNAKRIYTYENNIQRKSIKSFLLKYINMLKDEESRS